MVRVSSLGAIDSPSTTMILRDAKGNTVASATIPPMKAPLDLVPKWADITIRVLDGTDLSSGSVEIDPDHKLNQITRDNDIVKWGRRGKPEMYYPDNK